MQSYLKSKPVFIQILLFVGMAMGLLMIFSLIGMSILSGITGISAFDVANIAVWKANPKMIIYVRGMLVLQFLGLFLIPSLLFAYFSDPKPLQYVGLKKPVKPIYWVLGIASLIVAIPLVEFTGLLNRQINFGSLQHWVQSMEDEAMQQIKFMLGKKEVSELIMNIIFISLFAGIGEELFFRGVLQRLFIKATKNPWAGIIITAFFFSAMHLQFFGFIPRFLMGILLGAVYWYSGSLIVTMAAHFFYDALIIVLAYFNPEMLENNETTMFNGSALIITTIVSAVLTGLLIWIMKKNSAVTYNEVYRNDDIPKHQDLSF
jgi:membrane protease YdiL (CAAX protease family)